MKLPMEQSITLQYSAELRDRWPRPLADEWFANYPQIFDADDLRLTIKQTSAHFAEWFVAVHLYETQGALSLLEKYAYGNHGRKVELLDSFLSARDCAFLRNLRATHGVQPPDLFVYVPNSKRFWFAEVKRTEPLTDLQRESHVAIAQTLGVPVQMFYVRRA
jgi:hypothetical protein